ncbi:hypothetical protein HOK68_01485 [Candidatus Woesearchaeota archaeon]|nr:hypothetical protein [Candidatus Woesearchaeota archaeon]MBT4387078.1 hypothetical protein [Candidatus Woesearchaeota archaeon]MBT4596165.1 hypothetical protein [Candidatus Woesearchaeota archaeon]MBT5741612.1 hypothetical protein [Candidatus Woesearchaeota archaeon]MBT6505433.1 hypothetical protein [Candidatus Woesearchaeota archaeon]
MEVGIKQQIITTLNHAREFMIECYFEDSLKCYSRAFYKVLEHELINGEDYHTNLKFNIENEINDLIYTYPIFQRGEQALYLYRRSKSCSNDEDPLSEIKHLHLSYIFHGQKNSELEKNILLSLGKAYLELDGNMFPNHLRESNDFYEKASQIYKEDSRINFEHAKFIFELTKKFEGGLFSDKNYIDDFIQDNNSENYGTCLVSKMEHTFRSLMIGHSNMELINADTFDLIMDFYEDNNLSEHGTFYFAVGCFYSMMNTKYDIHSVLYKNDFGANTDFLDHRLKNMIDRCKKYAESDDITQRLAFEDFYNYLLDLDKLSGYDTSLLLN